MVLGDNDSIKCKKIEILVSSGIDSGVSRTKTVVENGAYMFTGDFFISYAPQTDGSVILKPYNLNDVRGLKLDNNNSK